MRSKGSRNAKTAKVGFRTSPTWMLVAGGVVALLVLSFVLPGIVGKSSTAGEAAVAKKLGVAVGTGLPAGSAVPAFSGTNLQTGRRISSQSVFAHKTLLFFSEGVMCQACFEQIQGIEKVGNQLAKRGIQLVSITPDTVHDLEQARRAYGIDTPLISDANRRISESFNTLGRGMHSDTPGHAFALIYRGKVLWYRDYYLPPYRTMYVQPRKLLTDITNA